MPSDTARTETASVPAASVPVAAQAATVHQAALSVLAAADLAVHGQPVAHLHSGGHLPAIRAPRPYLHPVASLGGAVLTEAEPMDHLHHLGLSLAFSDLNGSNFWGGSTYTADGPAMLPNHGTQVPVDRAQDRYGDGKDGSSSSAVLSGRVSWRSAAGIELAVETRSITALAHPEAKTWGLTLESVMVPGAGADALEVSSSAVKGRKGAGYGGIFWRFPRGTGQPLILSAAGAGEETAHGSRSPWLSITMFQAGGPVTVILAQHASLAGSAKYPWFIRAKDYLGAGPAVAWSEPARADRFHPLELSLHAVIHDGPVETSDRALDLLRNHPNLTSLSLSDRTP